jgi:Ca-activated chloride channel family protein
MNNCQFKGRILPSWTGVLTCPFLGAAQASLLSTRFTLMLTQGLTFVLLLAGLVQAQEPEFTLNVNVDLVELSVTVLDESDRDVSGLEALNFEIFEDSVQQDISLFLHDDRPVSLGLVIDNSRSMERKKERVDVAAVSFMRLSNPQDEAFLVHFDDTVRLAQDFTSDIGVIEETLESISPYGQTSLFDAIMTALEKIKEGRYDQKAILLVSDGADNSSAAVFDELLESVRQSDAAVYTIGVLNNSAAGQEARIALEALSDASGGRAFFPQTVDEIPALTENIARELRALYTLGYIPTNSDRDGSWRSVRVYVPTPVETPSFQVNYRHGYYAPDR